MIKKCATKERHIFLEILDKKSSPKTKRRHFFFFFNIYPPWRSVGKKSFCQAALIRFGHGLYTWREPTNSSILLIIMSATYSKQQRSSRHQTNTNLMIKEQPYLAPMYCITMGAASVKGSSGGACTSSLTHHPMLHHHNIIMQLVIGGGDAVRQRYG